jgi:hypothetical protein
MAKSWEEEQVPSWKRDRLVRPFLSDVEWQTARELASRA